MDDGDVEGREIARAVLRELTVLGDTSLAPGQRLEAAARAGQTSGPVPVRIPGSLTPDQDAALQEGLAAETGTDRARIMQRLALSLEDQLGDDTG